MFGEQLIKAGIKSIRDGSNDFKPLIAGDDRIHNSLKNVGIDIPITDMDLMFYYLDWESWQTILTIIHNILKDYKWEAERYDCDNRSAVVSGLVSTLFRVNTCNQLYCTVSDKNDKQLYHHWCNIITDVSGNSYIFDLDNFGMRGKITSKNPILGNLKYELKAVRAG